VILRLDHKAGFRDRRAKIDSGRVVELDIHGSFRGYCFNACGFKSRPAHQKMTLQYSVEKAWTVYLLECRGGELYCGCTTDLDRRLKQHQTGKGSRYVRSRLPVTLIAQKGGMGHGEALRLEYAIKQLPKSQKRSILA
jgi:putative endonuclease